MTSVDGEDWLLDAALEPDVAGSLAPLYEACADGRLSMPFCADCSRPLELEQFVCDSCAGQACWCDVPLVGVVHSATTVHRREPGLVLAGEPYQVLDVELRSGHRLTMTTTDPQADSAAIGQPVTIGFRTVGTVAVPAVAIPFPLEEEVAR
jgi:uncharacterized OB-fold protein